MKKDKESFDIENKEVREATLLRNKQDKIRNRFAFLQAIDRRHFGAEYVKAQAKEACKILNELNLTPLNNLCSKLNEVMRNPSFMYDMYLTENEFGQLEPDEKRINALVIPENKEED